MNMSTALATRKRAKPAPGPGAAAGAGKRRRKVSMAFSRARPVSLLRQPSFHPGALIGSHTFAQGPIPLLRVPSGCSPNLFLLPTESWKAFRLARAKSHCLSQAREQEKIVLFPGRLCWGQRQIQGWWQDE